MYRGLLAERIDACCEGGSGEAVRGGGHGNAPSLADIVNETRQTYKGQLVVGEDLMTFDIGESEIAVGPSGELIRKPPRFSTAWRRMISRRIAASRLAPCWCANIRASATP